MSSNNLLRKQVISEIRKRKLVAITFTILTFVYLTISLVFGDMGLFRYIALEKTKDTLESEIIDINSENERIRTHIKLLKEDPFYREKIAREEFGLAKPDEYIFLYENK